MVKMEKVDSSNIDEIGHDETSNTLAVKFKNGGTYHYHNVPKDKYEALKGARSIGSHLHTSIKPHHGVKKI